MREQRFRLLAMRVLVGQPLALGAGLLAAHGGLGAWAMVVNQAVATASVFALFLMFGRLPLRPALDLAALRELWPVAGHRSGPSRHARALPLFLLALGAMVAEAVLGQAHLAFRMVDAVAMMVWQAAARIGMPRLCALQHDRPALAACYGQIAQLQALLGVSSAVGIALVADDLVLALLGPEWAGTGSAAAVAAWAAALTFLHGNHFSLFVAVGKARLNLHVAAAQLAVPLLALLLLQPATPTGVALAWATGSLVVTPPVAWVVLRELDRSLPWLLRQVAPAILAVAAMVPAVLLVQGLLGEAPPLLRCLAAAAAGLAVFGVVAWTLLRGRLPEALLCRPGTGLPAASTERA
jgi:O-antigen/teichoic acid export membrane protein